jgi:DNA-binding winged helix-turn-helix (wHTH) protein
LGGRVRKSRGMSDKKQYGSLKIDFKAHAVYLHGLELSFIPRDLSLLLFLACHPNQTFTREQLIEQVWGMDYKGSNRAVDLAVKRIRKTLGAWPLSEGELKTLRGVGYQLCVYETDQDAKEYGNQVLLRALKDTIDRLGQLETLLTELLAGKEHTIDNPNTSITALFQAVREEKVAVEEATEFLQIYTEETEKLQKMLEALLDSSSFSTSDIRAEKTPSNS